MKKLYFALTLAAVALSASAETYQISPAAEAQAPSRDLKFRTCTAIKHPNRISIDDKVEPNWTELGKGTYTASTLAAVYGGSTSPVSVTIFEDANKAGMYKVVGVWPDMITDGSGTLLVDATNPKCVVVHKQFTGIVDESDGDTYIGSYSAIAIDEAGLTAEQFLATEYAVYNASLTDGVIIFPANSLMLQWPEAPANSPYNTDPEGWYGGAQNNGMLVLPGANYVDPWGEVVEATFLENVIYKTFTGNDNTKTVEVGVQKNSETGMYRIVDPWKATYAAIGVNMESPELEFDASNPDDVIIDLQSTGLGSQTAGTYAIFSESWWNLEEENPEEYAKITLVENADGTSTLTLPVNSCTIYATGNQKFYYATTALSTLTFKTFKTDGIQGVTTEADSNAPAMFFNLQGARVENPAQGQLVIKVQGGKATKTIVK